VMGRAAVLNRSRELSCQPRSRHPRTGRRGPAVSSKPVGGSKRGDETVTAELERLRCSGPKGCQGSRGMDGLQE